MKHRLASFSLLVSASLLCAAAMIARSAPIVPGPPPLEDSVKSLRDLGKVHLVVNIASPQAVEAGFTADKVKAQWAKRLTTVGLEVADKDGPEVARLELTVQSVTAESAKNAIGVLFQLKLHQRVRIERTAQTLKLATYTQDLAALDNMNELRDMVGGGVDAMLERFLAKRDAATMAKQ